MRPLAKPSVSLAASQPRIRSWALLLICCAMLVGPSARSDAIESAQPSPTQLALYEGLWRRIDDLDADGHRLRSIDSAIRDLSWIVRRMAAGVLKQSTAPPAEMQFTWDGERLHQLVTSGSGEVSRRPVELGAPPRILTDPRGEDFASSWTWTSDGLQVDWKQHQAEGSNLYRIDPQTRTLVVEHRIQVTALSGIEPIVYRSHFGRDSLPAVSSARIDVSTPGAVTRETR